jgi:hypothetical protein
MTLLGASFPLAELTSEQSKNAVVGSIILIVVVLVLFGGVFFYRRWMNAEDTTSAEGFTLSDLRRLHKEGKMSTEEFEKAKAVLIGSLRPAATADKPTPGPKTDPPGFDMGRPK